MAGGQRRIYLALDLGASGGRVLAGGYDGTRLTLAEVHRFANGPVRAAGHLYWDVLDLWAQILDGLRLAERQYGQQVASLGIDTWGVDFALLDRNDELLGNPYNYRDPQTRGIVEESFQRVPRAEIFAETGLQFLEINTLFQLLAMQKATSPLLDCAASLLMMPDFFNWLLTGEKRNEFTDATTTQFLNPMTRQWSHDLLNRFGLPTHILQSIVHPGETLGELRRSVQTATGLGGLPVVLPGTHDTASAVMAVPTQSPPSDQPDWCYISSGTWSLMGAEVAQPVVNERACELNFTNEGGVGGTIRLLKNITGLWLVQECRRIWQRQGRSLRWEQLTALAAEAAPLKSLIHPDDPCFTAPEDMPAAIAAFCRNSGQPVPVSEGETIRCALQSLALRYRMVLDDLESLTGSPIRTIHIVGGGTQNQQLCQWAADACHRPVVAGPIEATALGNLLMQAIAAGDVQGIPQARAIVAESFPLQTYEPRNDADWDAAYDRMQRFTAS